MDRPRRRRRRRGRPLRWPGERRPPGRRLRRRPVRPGWCRARGWCRRGGPGSFWASSDRCGGGVEHDGREVEEHAVEDGGQVGVGAGVQPQGGRPPARSASASAFSCSASSPRSSTRTSRPPGCTGRALPSSPAVSAGVPSGLTSTPSRVVRVSFVHTASSGSSAVEPAGLAEHRGGGALPVLPGRLGPGEREGERAGLGLELGGLVETALDGLLRGHVPTLGAHADPSHTL